MAKLSEWGIETDPNDLPFLKFKERQTVTIRLVEKLPTSPPRENPRTREKIVTKASFLVEDDEGQKWRLDVTGERLLTQLGALDDIESWFQVRRIGKDFDTRYDVSPCSKEEIAKISARLADPNRLKPGAEAPSGKERKKSKDPELACAKCNSKAPPIFRTDEGTRCEKCLTAGASAASSPSGIESFGGSSTREDATCVECKKPSAFTTATERGPVCDLCAEKAVRAAPTLNAAQSAETSAPGSDGSPGDSGTRPDRQESAPASPPEASSSSG